MPQHWMYHDSLEAKVVDEDEIRGLEEQGWRGHPECSDPVIIPEYVEEVFVDIPPPSIPVASVVVSEDDQKKIDAERTLKTLRGNAKELGIPGYQRMKQETLVNAIQAKADAI